MIIKTFDNGWGPEWPVKKFEQKILKSTFEQLEASCKNTVVINSTWYSTDYHQTVLSWLRQNKFDRIVLIAMLDAAIVYPYQFDEFNCEVVTIGYYPGSKVDFWSLYLAHNFSDPHLIDLCRVDLITIPYMCLNRKPHWHRKKFYNELQQRNLVKSGLVSMGNPTGLADRVVEPEMTVPELAPNSSSEQYGIPNDITSLGNIANWKRIFLNVVTETVYGVNANHFVSEKIYKPMLGLRPFLVYDTDGAHHWLQHRGFEDYTRDFADISDLDLQNPDNIAPFLEQLCQQPNTYWRKKILDLNQKLMYNKQQFYKYVDTQFLTIQKGIVCPV